MEPVRVFLGLGSNLGDRMANLERGLRILGERIRLVRVSSMYETEPWGFADQPAFLNCVVEGETSASPERVLQFLKEAEQKVGRRASFEWGPRVLDADLLFYGRRIVNLPHLQVPHPRIPQRAFVLVPLAEIAADFVHPGLGLTVERMVADVEGQEGVRWHSPSPELGRPGCPPPCRGTRPGSAGE